MVAKPLLFQGEVLTPQPQMQGEEASQDLGLPRAHPSSLDGGEGDSPLCAEDLTDPDVPPWAPGVLVGWPSWPRGPFPSPLKAR